MSELRDTLRRGQTEILAAQLQLALADEPVSEWARVSGLLVAAREALEDVELMVCNPRPVVRRVG